MFEQFRKIMRVYTEIHWGIIIHFVEENENAMEELMSSLGPSERQQLAEGFLGNGAYDEPSNESKYWQNRLLRYATSFIYQILENRSVCSLYIFIYIIYKKNQEMHIFPQR